MSTSHCRRCSRNSKSSIRASTISTQIRGSGNARIIGEGVVITGKPELRLKSAVFVIKGVLALRTVVLILT